MSDNVNQEHLKKSINECFSTFKRIQKSHGFMYINKVVIEGEKEKIDNIIENVSRENNLKLIKLKWKDIFVIKVIRLSGDVILKPYGNIKYIEFCNKVIPALKNIVKADPKKIRLYGEFVDVICCKLNKEVNSYNLEEFLDFIKLPMGTFVYSQFVEPHRSYESLYNGNLKSNYVVYFEDLFEISKKDELYCFYETLIGDLILKRNVINNDFVKNFFCLIYKNPNIRLEECPNYRIHEFRILNLVD